MMPLANYSRAVCHQTHPRYYIRTVLQLQYLVIFLSINIVRFYWKYDFMNVNKTLSIVNNSNVQTGSCQIAKDYGY